MSISDFFPFRNRSTPEVSDVNVTQEPLPQDDGGMPNGWDLETSISIRKLAALFIEHGWLLSGLGPDGTPLPQDILNFITTQVDALSADEDGMYSTRGRMLFLKDEEFPGCVDIYLHVATATQDDFTCSGDDFTGALVD